MASDSARVFPFSALVGLDRPRLALVLAAINPRLGGVLLRGAPGSGRQTLGKALAQILPPLQAVRGCPFHCPPSDPCRRSSACRGERLDDEPDRGSGQAYTTEDWEVFSQQRPLQKRGLLRPPQVVGSRPLEAETVGAPYVVISPGVSSKQALEEPNALAPVGRDPAPNALERAGRGLLFLSEVDRLEPELISRVLDLARASRPRRGTALPPAPGRFVLVGTLNGGGEELPLELARGFELKVDVPPILDLEARVELLSRLQDFELEPEAFLARFQAEEEHLTRRMAEARARLSHAPASRSLLTGVARRVLACGVTDLGRDRVLREAALALAAWHGEERVSEERLDEAAGLVLPNFRPFSSATGAGLGLMGGNGGTGASALARDLSVYKGESSTRSDGAQAVGAQGLAGQGASGTGVSGASGSGASGSGASVSGAGGSGASGSGAGLAAAVPTGAGPLEGLAAARSRGGMSGEPARGEGGPREGVSTDRAAQEVLSRLTAQLGKGEGEAGLGRSSSQGLVSSGPARAVCLLVDLSQSPGAERRLEVAKVLAEAILSTRRSRPVQVALVVGGGPSAALALRLSGDAQAVSRAFDKLSVGGEMPLAHALRLAGIELSRAKERGLVPVLVALTSSHADVPFLSGEDPVEEAFEAADQLQERGVASLVLEWGEGRGASPLCQSLAEHLGGTHALGSQMDEEAVVHWLTDSDAGF